MTAVRGLLAVAALWLITAVPALAQSGCAIFTFGNVPTAGQWNQCLATKQDLLAYTPVNRAGDSMQGRLLAAASTTFRSGFSLTPGVAPTTPVDGDIWTTTLGIYVRINGATVGPLTATGSTIPSVIQGDVLYASGVNTLAALAKSTSATRYLSNTGTSNNPAWAQINLANGVTGALPLANIATGTQDTVLGYFNSTTAAAATLPNCSGALTYSTSTHTFGCNASGAVVASGTPTANQVAQWTNATTIQGVNVSALLTAGNGITLTGTTTVGISVSQAVVTNSLSGNVSVSSTTYVDGPSAAQGNSTGATFKAEGTVTLLTGSNSIPFCKLWDGTTVAAATGFNAVNIGRVSIPLSGRFVNPTGNIRISCNENNASAYTMQANTTSNGNVDSTITVTRIAN